MEKQDLDLIKEHKASNHHLGKLWEEHLKLEKEIESLENNPGALANSELIHKLKKKKLMGRDQIEEILKQYRT